MVCNCGNSSVNWSKRIKEIDNRIRKEVGLDPGELKDVVLSIKTNSLEDIEPAFFVAEDDIFLEVDVIHFDSGAIQPAIISKNNIQSIMILGCYSEEDPKNPNLAKGINSKTLDLNSNKDKSVENLALNGMYL